MNVRRRVEGHQVSPEARADIVRILGLWAEARARFGKGGPFLFGAFSAADIIYAPVVSRFVSYGLERAPVCAGYIEAMMAHPAMAEWSQQARAQAAPEQG